MKINFFLCILTSCNWPKISQLPSLIMSCWLCYRCKSGACVDKSRVCDMTDDCGDLSDEANCKKDK